jgi:hypothetical protein
MKKIIPIGILLLTGLIVFAGYYFQVQLSPILGMILDWGILLVGVTGLLGIFYLVKIHLTRLSRKEKGRFFSFVFLISFVVTATLGLVLSLESEMFQNLILNVQIPVEASLLGVLAVTLLYVSLRVVRTHGWTPMTIGFISSAMILSILNLGLLPLGLNPVLDGVVSLIQRLPIVGARGVLLGMALGGLVIGLKVLLTIDRPLGEE